MNARSLPDGSCECRDDDGQITSWPSSAEWADAWLEEWRREVHGPACDFINVLTRSATDGVVSILATLAGRAAISSDPDELTWVGAGPVEDLVSHSGNGRMVMSEVETVASNSSAFAEALHHVLLGREVEQVVKDRLVPLGARDLGASAK